MGIPTVYRFDLDSFFNSIKYDCKKIDSTYFYHIFHANYIDNIEQCKTNVQTSKLYIFAKLTITNATVA